MVSHLEALAAPEDHHLVCPAGLLHDPHEGYVAEIDVGQGVDVPVDLGVAPVEELSHAPYVVEVTVGDEKLFQEGEIKDVAKFMEDTVEVAGVYEGAAFIEDVDIAAHARFFNPPDARKQGVIFAQMDHGSS
jgi:hypothetical protein